MVKMPIDPSKSDTKMENSSSKTAGKIDVGFNSLLFIEYIMSEQILNQILLIEFFNDDCTSNNFHPQFWLKSFGLKCWLEIK